MVTPRQQQHASIMTTKIPINQRRSYFLLFFADEELIHLITSGFIQNGSDQKNSVQPTRSKLRLWLFLLLFIWKHRRQNVTPLSTNALGWLNRSETCAERDYFHSTIFVCRLFCRLSSFSVCGYWNFNVEYGVHVWHSWGERKGGMEGTEVEMVRWT